MAIPLSSAGLASPSARWALSDDAGVVFVLDEFARLPHLRKLGGLINAGRGMNTQLVLGVQSVAQLHDTYGRDRGQALLSGLVQSIALRVGDSESVKFVRGQLGRDRPRRKGTVRGTQRWENGRETYPVTESDLERLDDGEAIAIRPDGWVRGQLDQLEDVREDIDRAQLVVGWQARVVERLRRASSVNE